MLRLQTNTFGALLQEKFKNLSKSPKNLAYH